MSLGFPRGAGERAEAGAAGASPALSLLCGCSDSVFNYTAAGGSVPVPARRCAGKVGSFASCSCKAALGGGDGVSRGSLRGFPISRGVFGEPGRSGACLSSSVMCQGSVWPQPNSSWTRCFVPEENVTTGSAGSHCGRCRCPPRLVPSPPQPRAAPRSPAALVLLPTSGDVCPGPPRWQQVTPLLVLHPSPKIQNNSRSKIAALFP